MISEIDIRDWSNDMATSVKTSDNEIVITISKDSLMKKLESNNEKQLWEMICDRIKWSDPSATIDELLEIIEEDYPGLVWKNNE